MLDNKMQSYKEMWDERYNEQGHAYGERPNVFFREWLQKFEPGSILMPGDGEGRNGVFAAKSGWNVTSFDLSVAGKNKALELAKRHHVTIDYLVGDMKKLKLKRDSFDAIGLIYAHFQADRKSEMHKELDSYLKPGGVVILEAFSKEHLKFNEHNPNVGGPKDIDMLFSKQEIASDFEGYEILMLQEEETFLNEGKYHIGQGAVVRFIGRKLF